VQFYIFLLFVVSFEISQSYLCMLHISRREDLDNLWYVNFGCLTQVIHFCWHQHEPLHLLFPSLHLANSDTIHDRSGHGS